MKEKTKELSFTQYEKTCEDHICTEQRLCYCDRTGEVCSKITCWKFKKYEIREGRMEKVEEEEED
jgi:hypothetical protein